MIELDYHPDQEATKNREVLSVDNYAENFPPEKLFPEKALKIETKIKQRYLSELDNFLKNASPCPNLREIIEEILFTEAFGKEPDSKKMIKNHISYGDMTFRGYSEWISKEFFLDFFNRVKNFDFRTLTDEAIDFLIRELRFFQNMEIGLKTFRQTFSESIFLSHVTPKFLQIIKDEALLSRSQQEQLHGQSNFSTLSYLKKSTQEADQICFNKDQVNLRYASKGSRNFGVDIRGFVFVSTLDLLLNGETSFFSDDGLHAFNDAGNPIVDFDSKVKIVINRESVSLLEEGLEKPIRTYEEFEEMFKSGKYRDLSFNPFATRGEDVGSAIRELITPEQ